MCSPPSPSFCFSASVDLSKLESLPAIPPHWLAPLNCPRPRMLPSLLRPYMWPLHWSLPLSASLICLFALLLTNVYWAPTMFQVLSWALDAAVNEQDRPKCLLFWALHFYSPLGLYLLLFSRFLKLWALQSNHQPIVLLHSALVLLFWPLLLWKDIEDINSFLSMRAGMSFSYCINPGSSNLIYTW